MPDDKRLPYEFDIRVPLLVKPPAAGHAGHAAAVAGPRTVDGIALNIDLGPTLIEIAGLPAVEEMDGQSYLDLLLPPPPPPPPVGSCTAACAKDCAGLEGKGDTCKACVKLHKDDFKAAGCWSGGGENAFIRHFCDGKGPSLAPPALAAAASAARSGVVPANASAAQQRRHDFLVEYHGEYHGGTSSIVPHIYG